MKLLYAANSPYARKCRVVIREKGLSVEEVLAVPMDNPAELLAVNPLGAVPALLANDGETYCDSPLICEYLDSLPSSAPALFSASGKERFHALRLAALGDGLMDAAVTVVLENRRPKDERSQSWIDRKEGAIMRTIAVIAGLQLDARAPLDIGTLALACALDYVRFRLIHLNWQDTHPKLATWLEHVLQHPSLAATVPMP